MTIRHGHRRSSTLQRPPSRRAARKEPTSYATKTLTDTAPTTVETNELPRWDLSALFPSLDSPEFAEGFDRLLGNIDQLVDLFEELVSPRGGDPLRNACGDFERVLNALNDVSQQLESMGSYLYGCISTDSRETQPKPDSASCRSAPSRLTSCRHASPRGWNPAH